MSRRLVIEPLEERIMLSGEPIPLLIGTPFADRLESDGNYDLFQVTVNGGEHLIFQVDAADPYSDNELYVRYGGIPTRDEYDVAAKTPDRSDQSLEVPSAQAGTYYVMVYARDVYSSGENHTLRADTDATLPTLTLGTEVSGTLANTDDFDLYRVEVGADQHLIFQLDTTDPSDRNHLYIRQGALLTWTEYDYAATTGDRSDTFLEATLQPGTYYMMVYASSDYGGSSQDGYSLRVDTDAMLQELTLDGQEQLGPRTLLKSSLNHVVAHWIGGSGDWGNATNWDIATVPNN